LQNIFEKAGWASTAREILNVADPGVHMLAKIIQFVHTGAWLSSSHRSKKVLMFAQFSAYI
jgi:hypothetical protein